MQIAKTNKNMRLIFFFGVNRELTPGVEHLKIYISEACCRKMRRVHLQNIETERAFSPLKSASNLITGRAK